MSFRSLKRNSRRRILVVYAEFFLFSTCITTHLALSASLSPAHYLPLVGLLLPAAVIQGTMVAGGKVWPKISNLIPQGGERACPCHPVMESVLY